MTVSLKTLNTFGIDAKALRVFQFNTLTELRQGLADAGHRYLVLGGGSNILFTGDFDGTVLLNKIKGFETVKETGTHVWIKAGAGENWHELVMKCVAKNYGGIENLSLIPGTVGAAPIQNIGAYGVELKDVLEEVETWDIAGNATKIFKNEECNFGYRNSIFKTEAKGKYIILSVTFCLTKSGHLLKTDYGTIQQILNEKGITSPSIADISSAVIAIRSSKLPDPAKIGNSGSFFKNPSIRLSQLGDLLKTYPQLPHYPSELPGHSKLAAGWLIEQCGWKGYRTGDAGVHKDQALVLVNYGSATGSEIFDLAKKIAASVKDKFGIEIETEVNII